ncbi:LuxR C-terminal-related transcriptional regulator [Streptomyces sp. PA5.6]|uniref:LuxR C-terminal-related transcriptional regulator n=1 Tax=Streptomyces sp. PA5.6 TaxID=3035651 RepID=UPI003904CB13
MGTAAVEGGGSVGRAEEMRRLRDALCAGPVVAVVRGESGTGVSRLVDEVLGETEFAGWTQLRGTCPAPRGVGVGAPSQAAADTPPPATDVTAPDRADVVAPSRADIPALGEAAPASSCEATVAGPNGDDDAARVPAAPEIRSDGSATRPYLSPATDVTHLPPSTPIPPESGVRASVAAVTQTPADDDALAPIADALAGLPCPPGGPGWSLPAVTGIVGLLVPELAEQLPEPPAAAASVATDPASWRALLPRAVTALLAELGDTVLVIEDVHHADRATLALLHHLMSAMPPRLRLVVTEDAAPGLPLFGVALGTRAPVAEIDVRPWTCGETEEFVRRWLHAHRPQHLEELHDLVVLVHEWTGGLPEVAEALLRAAEEQLEEQLRAGAAGGRRTPLVVAVDDHRKVRDIGSAGSPMTAAGHSRRQSDRPHGQADSAYGAHRYGAHRYEAHQEPGAAVDGISPTQTPPAPAHNHNHTLPPAHHHTLPPTDSVLAAIRSMGVPPPLRRDYALRSARLDEEALRIVEAAAVLDHPVPVAVLAEVGDVAADRAEAAVERCLRQAVLRADGPHPVFRHPLDRRAALARMPAPRQARLSLRAARALHRGGAGRLPLVDLARLYRAAGRVREAVRCLVAAADRAATAGDYSSATSLYTRAVDEDPRADGRIRAAAKLARTAQLARADQRVVAAVRRVLDEDAPPPRLRGEIRLHLSVVLRNQSGGALDSLNEVARAIPDLELTDPQTAARAMAVAAIPSIKGWPVERHLHWLDRCEALDGQVTEPGARAAIAANRATALMLLGDRRAWAAADALRGPAATAMEAAHHTRGWTNLAHAATALGYDARAREFLARAAHGLAETSSPYLEGLTQTAQLVLGWHEGRWEGLHAAADRTTRAYAEIPDLTAEAMLVRGLTALHVLGDVPQARRDLAEAARTTRYDTGVILTAAAAATARVHLEAARPGQACEAVEETLHRLERTGGWVWAGEVAPTAVEALHASGQDGRARHLVAEFDAATEHLDAPAARAALTMCRALLAEADERPDEAVGLWEDAEVRWRELGRPFDAARAAEARGRCLLDAPDGTPGDIALAAGVIQDAVAAYRELGARWDIARCQRLLRRHDIVTTHRRGRLGYGDQLSPREQEVAQLVVQGRANREIAESLVLSTRTVEHHVARIMRKLNVTSRTGIARAGGVRGAG